MSQNNIDVLIVGAGPVGLFCANELSRHGISCRIIDKKSHISEHSKALGIHIRTLDVLEDCGFIEEVLNQGQRIDGAQIKSKGKILVDVLFSAIDANRHFLIDLPQDKTENILEQGLCKKGIQVEWDCELTHLSQTSKEITATIKKKNNKIELFNADWLIACDGAHSTVRHQLNMEFKGAAYQQNWWLADVLIDWQVTEHQMAIYLSNKGPLACFPMGNKRYRIVMTAPNSTEAPKLEDIHQEFKQRSTDNAVLSNPIWLTRFSIHHRQIQHYRQDRVFFAGDAAHIHSPMGGQGLNTGIQDVYNLAWKLALFKKGNVKPGLLDTYHEERFPIGQAVLQKTDKMTRMILLRNSFVITLRNLFIKFITSFNCIKKALLRDLAELNISYSNSSIVHQSGSLKQIRAGEFLPDFKLLHPISQKSTNRNELLQGTQHHLLIFSGTNPQKLTEVMKNAQAISTQYTNKMQIHLVFAYKPETNQAVDLWIDEQQQIHQRFGIKKPALILVRPDKYIGLLQNPINLEELKKKMYF